MFQEQVIVFLVLFFIIIVVSVMFWGALHWLYQFIFGCVEHVYPYLGPQSCEGTYLDATRPFIRKYLAVIVLCCFVATVVFLCFFDGPEPAKRPRAAS